MKTPALRAAEAIANKVKCLHEIYKGTPPLESILRLITEDGESVIAAAYPAEIRSASWQPMVTAPRDGTAVLLLMRGAEVLPERCKGFFDIQFVGRTRAEWGADWGWIFAAPVGCGGFPDQWLAGWMPLPETKNNS
jgi:hypothetical protein